MGFLLATTLVVQLWSVDLSIAIASYGKRVYIVVASVSVTTVYTTSDEALQFSLAIVDMRLLMTSPQVDSQFA